ncbi:MAG: BMP family ABC transporter substrate-binding protein [Clostridiales bacterium]|nr:BMP family ABC transporter substrate-binding protein [Clostridiales bacterium]
MKRILLVFISLVLMLSVSAAALADGITYALVTDVGNIDDHGFNESTWKGLQAFAEANGLVEKDDYDYYRPSEDSDDARLEAITLAVDNGAKVILLPGYLWSTAVATAAKAHPDVVFLGVDLSIAPDDYPANITNFIYKEEQSGFMAGAAAVMDGYTKLGFLGGIDVPAVVRFGFGFLQGVDYAAQALGVTPEVKYWYSNAFWPTDEIKAKMDSWYAEGTEVVFSCGGGILFSCLAAAETAGGAVIGVDTNQGYDSELIITSAIKVIPEPMKGLLQQVYDNGLAIPAEVAGVDIVLSIEQSACGLPTDEETWRFRTLTVDDYYILVAALQSGGVVISDAIDTPPVTVATTVDYQN